MLAAMTPLQRAVYRARQNDPEGVKELQKLLKENPKLWQDHGGLSLRVLESWMLLVANKDSFQFCTLEQHLDDKRKELAGHAPSPLESLLVERILGCYVRLMCFEGNEANSFSNQQPKSAKYLMARQEQANRQYLAAIKTLATVRQLVAKTARIEVEMIHRFVPETPQRPIIGQTNGEQPRGNPESVNGRNCLNGRPRGTLDPIIAAHTG
jgi:hypothetical protein